MDDVAEMGPVDYLVIEFPGSRMTGEGMPILVDPPGYGYATVPPSAPRNRTSSAPGRTPARSSTSLNGTPVHSAVLTAPRFHFSPSMGG